MAWALSLSALTYRISLTILIILGIITFAIIVIMIATIIIIVIMKL